MCKYNMSNPLPLAGSGRSEFALVGITWNKYGWERVDTESSTGYRYAQYNPGHESFNFNFDVPDPDDRTFIYGYSTGMKKNTPGFKQPGLVFFYSKNNEEGTGYIVGVYGNARRMECSWDSVQMSEPEGLYTNIVAEREYSALFPVYLDADPYKALNNWARIVPQGGIRYIDRNTAKMIMDDAIREVGAGNDGRLRRIRSLFDDWSIDDEQGASESRQKVLDGMHWRPLPSDSADYVVKMRHRDSTNVEILKRWFCYQCQICSHSIRTKYGGRYVEAAHIRPKREEGSDVPSNILILCPNHHKEFDYGDVNIIEHKADMIKFKMNGRSYAIDLVTPHGKFRRA